MCFKDLIVVCSWNLRYDTTPFSKCTSATANCHKWHWLFERVTFLMCDLTHLPTSAKPCNISNMRDFKITRSFP